MRAVVLLLLSALGTTTAHADERVLQFLEDRYTHALMHHTGAPSEEPPDALGRADCTGVRALSRSQTNMARQLGRIFERSGIHIDVIAASRWCEALHTAQLLQLRPVTEEALLNLLGDDPEDQVDAILSLVDGQRATETALLVTHGPNIEALTGIESVPGEVVVFRLRPGADIEIRGSFRPE